MHLVDKFEDGGAGTEDCLILNIYTPSSILKPNSNPIFNSDPNPNSNANQESRRKLPVLVYIHGGGFIVGNPLSWPFEHWIEQFPDIVIVSVYYRLSIFGFLAAPDSKDGKNGKDGKDEDVDLDYNVGFLDQLEALKWVKKVSFSFSLFRQISQFTVYIYLLPDSLILSITRVEHCHIWWRSRKDYD
jgi:carboxylesterase type B